MARISLTEGGRIINGREEVYDQSSGGYVPKELNAAQTGGARGEGFAEAFTEAGGADILKRNPGASITGASSVLGGYLSESDLATAASRSLFEKSSPSGSLASDAQKTSQFGTTQAESTVAAGTRSTQKGLTDKEVDELAAQGFLEGDFVPGRGILKPDGTFDRSAFDILDATKKRAEEIQRQLQELEKQDKTTASGAVVSDKAIVDAETAAIETVNQPDTIVSGALELLQKQEDILQKQLQAEIQSINNSFNRAEGAAADAQAREAGATSVGLAQAGGYLGFSGSGTGVMLSLTKSHRAEMQDLELRRQEAVSKARSAAADRRMDIVRDMAAEVQRIEDQAYERQREYNKEMKSAADKQQAEAERQQTQIDIFSAIQNGAKSAEDIFAALGGAVDIDEIGGFLKQIGSSSSDGFSFTASNTAKLLGSGMSQDDIKTFNEYVNENGYDATIRGALTPAQRAAADKIFRDVKETTGKDDPNEKVINILDLNRIEDTYGVRFPPGVTAGKINQFLQDNWGVSPEEMQAGIDAIYGPQDSGSTGEGGSITFSEEWMRGNLTDSQLKGIADLVGASSWYKGASSDVENLFNDPTFLESFEKRIKEAARQFNISEEEALGYLI